MKLLPWWILVYWYKGPAITIHSTKTGKIIFTLFQFKINQDLIRSK